MKEDEHNCRIVLFAPRTVPLNLGRKVTGIPKKETLLKDHKTRVKGT